MDTACPVTMISEKAMPVYHNVKAQRPVDEIVLSVCGHLGVENENTKERQRIETMVMDICNGEGTQELLTFDSQLQMLLNTLFTQIADFVDRHTKGTNVQVDNVDCDVLGGLLSPATVSDVVAAARESLLLYHQQSKVLRDPPPNNGLLSPSNKQPEERSPESSPGRKTPLKRRLSSVWPDKVGRAGSFQDPTAGVETTDLSDSKTIADTFVKAFQSGANDVEKSAPKRRPSTRVERSDLSPSVSPSTRSNCSGSVTCDDITFVFPTEQEIPETISRRSRRKSTVCPVPIDLEKRLYSLTTLQYFDIIAQTLSILMCVVYEEQLLWLTTEGSTSGISRLAEWVTARIIDELSQEGIDSTVPLDVQLLHCVEGIAFEDDCYHWRRLSKIGEIVLETVWGETPPPDISTGRIECKDKSLNWYEWGVLQKPGFKDCKGQSFTGPRLNPLQYNYRLSTIPVIKQLGLNEVSVKSPVRTPSFLGQRPGESLLNKDPGAVTCPGLTLSAPPEGSFHRGNHKQKPHIRPKSPVQFRELERKYKRKHRRSRQKQKLESEISNSESGSCCSVSDSDIPHSCNEGEVNEQQQQQQQQPEHKRCDAQQQIRVKKHPKIPPEPDLSSEVVEGPSPKRVSPERCCCIS